MGEKMGPKFVSTPEQRDIDGIILRGRIERHGTFKTIADTLNRLGHRNNHGGPWRNKAVSARASRVVDRLLSLEATTELANEVRARVRMTPLKVDNRIVSKEDHDIAMDGQVAMTKQYKDLYHAERKSHDSARRQLAAAQLEVERLRSELLGVRL
jgi:hypothetical protein